MNEMKWVRKCQNSLKFNKKDQEKDEIFRDNRGLEKK